MDIRTLQSAVVDALEDVKGQDIVAFNTTGLTGLFDRVVIATGTSNRHAKALADSVREQVKKKGGSIISVEGGETGEWVLVDLGDVVVHIMQPAIRAYYNLEEIWGVKPVALKSRASARTGGDAPGPTRARKVASGTRAAGTAGKTAARKGARTGAKTSAKTGTKAAAPSTGRAGAKTPGKTAARSAAGKTAAQRAPATKKTTAAATARKTGVRRPKEA